MVDSLVVKVVTEVGFYDGISGGKVVGKLESSELGESLDSESRTKLSSSKGISEGNVERKYEVSSGVSYKVALGARLVVDEGTLAMGVDMVASTVG